MERETIASPHGVDKRNTTVYLCLSEFMEEDDIVRDRFFVLDDGKNRQPIPRSDGEEVEVLRECSIPPPPKDLRCSAMTVIGEQLYLVGGLSYPKEVPREEDPRDRFECHNDVYRINPAVENKWEPCKSLITPRACAQLYADRDNNKIYAFGCARHSSYSNTRYFPGLFPDEYWAEIFDTERNLWKKLEIKSSKFEYWSWRIGWCFHIPKSTQIVFHAFDPTVQDCMSTIDTLKLYVCDYSTKECDYFDETFSSGLKRLVIANNNSSDWAMALKFGPAQQGDYLYFPGQFHIYCYCLRTKSWCSKPMGGIDLRSTANASSLNDLQMVSLGDKDFGALKPMGGIDLISTANASSLNDLQMVSLGDKDFGALWFDPVSRMLSWTKFQVLNPPESGAEFPVASGFSVNAAKKFLHPLHEDVDMRKMSCFVISHSEKRTASDPKKDSMVDKRPKIYPKDDLACITASREAEKGYMSE